jgi:phosphoglycolate phosphatase
MSKNPALSTVIIDFDDTLCLSEEACFLLENEVLRRRGRSPQSREVHCQTWGMPIEHAIALRSPGIDITTFWRIMQPTHQEFIQSGLIDEISKINLAVLDELLLDGFQLFVLTSRTLAEVTHLIDPHHHLTERITALYHAGTTLYLKPDIRVFDILLADYHSYPKNAFT